MKKKVLRAFTAVLMAGALAMTNCINASARELRTDSEVVSNCRTNSDLRKDDNTWVELKESYIIVRGERIYAGQIWGKEDYDLFGDDDVKCRVQSNAFEHYAVISTDEESDITSDYHRGIAAITDWATLAGGNGDIGWANFSAGYYVN